MESTTPSILTSIAPNGHTTEEVAAAVLKKDAEWGDGALWITKGVPSTVTGKRSGPLAGVPFAVKDNIDVAGQPTTAACPAFSRVAEASSFVVELLIQAGAVPVGKTNLDQFATGLVGVRSPYGTPRNFLNPSWIPGGSSSGSATAVAAGIVPFSLGTDTAGSGRVPAALNGIIGLKPTRGLLSTRGVVPACRSLDCVSLFTRNVASAATLLGVTAVYDAADPFARQVPQGVPHRAPAKPVIGVPRETDLQFFGWDAGPELFRSACEHWRKLGASVLEIDYSPFAEAARLLYEGPWVAERLSVIETLLATRPEAVYPVTRDIISKASSGTSVATFRALYKLEALKREAAQRWQGLTAMMTPTLPFVPTLEQVEAEPFLVNSRLGTYTNHFNLTDLCGVAVPWSGTQGIQGWGVTLSAPAFHDDVVLDLAARFVGEATPPLALQSAGARTRVAVCGAHLTGLPLNSQLQEAGAKLVAATKTAPKYRFFALPNTTPPKPGLAKVAAGGVEVEVEVWELDLAAYGAFVAKIPSPLGIGTIELVDGSSVQGFLCEAHALEGATDISHFGGWRAYLASRTPQK